MLFSARALCGRTPAHYAVCADADDGRCEDIDVGDIVSCLETLHDGLAKYFEPLLDLQKNMAMSQSFSNPLARGFEAMLDSMHLSVRDDLGVGLTPVLVEKQVFDFAAYPLRRFNCGAVQSARKSLWSKLSEALGASMKAYFDRQRAACEEEFLQKLREIH